MDAYSGVVYPAAVAIFLLLMLVGGLRLLTAPARVLLRVMVVAAWVASAVQALAIVALLATAEGQPSLPMTIGYLIASIALLPLLGVGHLGEPRKPGSQADPERPVLSPSQVAQVNAMAAVLVGAALVVVAWRLHAIVLTVVP